MGTSSPAFRLTDVPVTRPGPMRARFSAVRDAAETPGGPGVTARPAEPPPSGSTRLGRSEPRRSPTAASSDEGGRSIGAECPELREGIDAARVGLADVPLQAAGEGERILIHPDRNKLEDCRVDLGISARPARRMRSASAHPAARSRASPAHPTSHRCRSAPTRGGPGSPRRAPEHRLARSSDGRHPGLTAWP
jgi:hypothetical protein